MLIPVGDLADETRAQLTCTADDVAVSRLDSRTGSKIIDADAASLLSRFREPRSVVEAVILFADERDLDPDSILESAYSMLQTMVNGGVLVQTRDDGDPDSTATLLTAGDSVLDSIVTRLLQRFADTEVYLLCGPGDARSVLKIERPEAPGDSSVRARLTREADFLANLTCGIAPSLLGRGLLHDRTFLEIEFVPGIDALTASQEWRDRRDQVGRRALLALATSIAGSYARLHADGVLHGDVHPRNVLIGSDGSVRLIDFGLARAIAADGSLPHQVERGGVPFFFEPELARSYLEGELPIRASPEGEQYSVAAMIFLLMTGTHTQDFRLEREGMLQDIVEQPVLSFADRGAGSWPAFEAVLKRALSKDAGARFRSMDEFAGAVSSLSSDGTSYLPSLSRVSSPIDRILARIKVQAGIGGTWINKDPLESPSVSMTYGSCGIALGLLCIAQRENDPVALATADVWACSALRGSDRDGAFYNADFEITPKIVGHGSPYHTASGTHATCALIARAAGNLPEQVEATSEFIKAAARPVTGLDLTFGKSGIVMGSAILLDAAFGLPGDWTALREFGDASVSDLWNVLDSKPGVEDADIDHLGIAHGWAGFLYATLQWHRISNSDIPGGVFQRLDELSALAMPAGRGVEWPWVIHAAGDPATMAGWCNGSCGQVFLWSLAHDLFGDSRWLAMAEKAAWNSWESNDASASLCCGLVGRAYALLNFFRHSGDPLWLDRARTLAHRAATNGRMPSEHQHSLYKGEFGLAVLAADLEAPDEAVMPFFEPFGYSSSAK